MQKQFGKQLFLSLLTIFLWASCYVAVRAASLQFSPFALTFLRFFASGLTVLLMMPFYQMQKPRRQDLPLFLGSALTAYSLYSCLMALGARTVTASVSSFVMALSPVIAPMFALLLLKEHMKRIQWISIGISGSGVLIMLFTNEGFTFAPGILWVLLGAVLFALYNIIQRILLRRYETFEVTAYSTLIGAVTLLPFLPAAIREGRVATPGGLLIVGYLGAVSAIAYLFWSMALKLAASTSEVTNFMFLTPILTTVIAFVTMGELPPLVTYLGGGLMLAGLILTNLAVGKKEALAGVEAES